MHLLEIHQLVHIFMRKDVVTTSDPREMESKRASQSASLLEAKIRGRCKRFSKQLVRFQVLLLARSSGGKAAYRQLDRTVQLPRSA
jgi:hypothetical protein